MMLSALLVALAGLGLAPGSSRAEEAEPVAAVAPDGADDDALALRGTLDWITAYELTSVAASDANPGNRYLRLPAQVGFTELRPNIRLELGSRWQLVVRPRLSLRVDQLYVDDVPEVERASAAAEFIEVYGAWRVSDGLSLSYGLQNFQWGPAESLSPSNRIFHDTAFTRTPLTFYRGKYLARVNVSVERSFSAVLLVETHSNDDPPFVAGEEFERKGLLKAEYTLDNGTDYAGLVFGRGERSRSWVGGYGSWSPTDALSFYLDVAHTLGSGAWYPSERMGLLGFEQSRTDPAKIRTFGVVGGRYVFENGVDLRLEYIHNDSGYSRDDLDLAIRVIREVAPIDPRVLGPYTSPGLEVVGRSYAYLSARIPDIGPGRRLQILSRYLLALDDLSGSALANLEWAASDAWMLYLSAGASHGARDRDLTRVLRASILFALKHTW